jgi:hypothetical protein
MDPITPLSFYRDHYSPGSPDKKGRDHKYVPIKLGGLSNAPEKYKPDTKKGWIQKDPGIYSFEYEEINHNGVKYYLSHNFYDVYVRVDQDPKFIMLLTCPYDILQKKARREKWIRAVCFTLTTDPDNISDLLARGVSPALEAMIAPEDPVNNWPEPEPVKIMIPDPLPAPMYINKEFSPRAGWISYLGLSIEEIPA